MDKSISTYTRDFADDAKKPLSPDYPIKIYIERDALSKYRDKWEMLLANA